jgi:tetratricopeptide (TPR) repeat protein
VTPDGETNIGFGLLKLGDRENVSAGNGGVSSDTMAEPRGSGTTSEILAECERLLETGDTAGAKQQLLSLATLTPADEKEWKRLHKLCIGLEQTTRAQLYTERFLRVCKNSAAAHLANARNFLPNRNDWDQVRKAIAEAQKNPRPEAGFWFEIAKMQKDIRDYEVAIVSARKSISFDPINVEARELLIAALGVLRQQNEIRGECLALARCHTQSNETDPSRWASLARLAAEAGASKQARKYIDIAAEHLSNVSYGAEVDLVRALILTRQPERAMKHLRHLLAAGSQNTWLWNTLIDTAMSYRYYDVALVAIEQLKAIPHQDPEFLYSLSVKDKTARSGGFLKRIVLDWLWEHGWRLG